MNAAGVHGGGGGGAAGASLLVFPPQGMVPPGSELILTGGWGGVRKIFSYLLIHSHLGFLCYVGFQFFL
jgi:hypothetical protein